MLKVKHDLKLKVTENVKSYFNKNKLPYKVVDIYYRSNHPDDNYLFMVIAQKQNGLYAVWTCWNESTKSLNYGHYDIESIEKCYEIIEEYTWEVK